MLVVSFSIAERFLNLPERPLVSPSIRQTTVALEDPPELPLVSPSIRQTTVALEDQPGQLKQQWGFSVHAYGDIVP